MAIGALKRALKFEEKLGRAKERSIEKICWEQRCRDEEEAWSKGKRERDGKREALERIGISVKEWNDRIRQGRCLIDELIERERCGRNDETNKEVEK